MGEDAKEINTERAESAEITEKAQHNCLMNHTRRRLKYARGLSQGESGIRPIAQIEGEIDGYYNLHQAGG